MAPATTVPPTAPSASPVPVPAPAAGGSPRVLRRPLGFPVGEGAPGPVAVVLAGLEDEAALGEVLDRLGAAGTAVRSSTPDRLDVALSRSTARFAASRPGAVLVRGGSVAALAGALAAHTAGVPVVHLEAGLRSFDRRSPQEQRRVVLDQLATLCCAPTATAVANLRAEGVADERILRTGTTWTETVRRSLPDAGAQEAVLAELGAPPGHVLLAWDDAPGEQGPGVLEQVLSQLSALAGEGVPVVVHTGPRVLDAVRDRGAGDLLRGLTLVPPQPVERFLALVRGARLVVSDSGDVQEAAAVLGRRLLAVRPATERPEGLGSSAVLVPGGVGLAAAVRSAPAGDPGAPGAPPGGPGPYGDGSASRVVVESLVRLLAPS
ncbi:UDP-N-acetylglucosamine 2-epimerase [Kineococcus aurantiacus]|uniref:UDP-N-acetylglucosamine 2-epimerase (Non-hydrolyzing) n=1 Tax=Kineococcus aurantiacus TaxID=37633 RepID=A0A7Y9AS00_9ACTN|nr:UDP-N-acetylglucosamine 2-epimerase (non-hydrolyzing) [Kineococcus aurantiacus]